MWRTGAWTLRWEFEWLSLVVEPGVLIVSGSLIKLQGVVSLAFLNQILKLKENHLNKAYKKKEICPANRIGLYNKNTY